MSNAYKKLLLSVWLLFITNEILIAEPGERKIALPSRATSLASLEEEKKMDTKEFKDQSIGDDIEGLTREFCELNFECKKSKEEIKQVLKSLAARKKITIELTQKILAEGDLLLVQALIELGAPFKLEVIDWRKIKNVALKEYLEANLDLFLFMYDENVQRCKKALEDGACVNVRQSFGYSTPLHMAVYNRKVETVKVLIESKADVNAQDVFGETPLHRAIVNNGRPLHVGKEKEQRSIIKLLLAAGARVDIKNDEGKTALDLAKKYRIEDVFAEFGIH